MPGKAELRELPVELGHEPVARHFGDDTRRRDGEGESVAFDDPVMRKGKIFHWKAVDQAMIGRGIEQLHRPAHGKVGGFQDVKAVDFLAIRRGHGP